MKTFLLLFNLLYTDKMLQIEQPFKIEIEDGCETP